MKNGERVGKGIRAGKEGGIPWFVFAKADQPLLRVKPTTDGSPPAEDAPLQRRKSAILATADGPGGNVGCPMSKAERAHFHDMLVAARVSLTDKELKVIADDLLEYARATIGERADQ